jgi:hypothetical protein
MAGKLVLDLFKIKFSDKSLLFVMQNALGIFLFTFFLIFYYSFFAEPIYLVLFIFIFLFLILKLYHPPKSIVAVYLDFKSDIINKIRNIKCNVETILIIILLFLILILVSEEIINSFIPSKVGDSIEGYLATAKWIYFKGLNFNPYNTRYSIMPFFCEINYSISFSLGNEIMAKILDAYFGFVLLVLFFSESKRILGINNGQKIIFIGILFFVFYNPGNAGFMWIFGVGKVDILGVLFLTLSLVLFFRYKLGKDNFTTIIFLFLGFACGIKYTNWIFTSIFILFLACEYWQAKRLKPFIINLLCFCLVLSPVFIKNYIQVCNPIAPNESLIFKNSIPIKTHNFHTQPGNLNYYITEILNLNLIFLLPLGLFIFIILLLTNKTKWTLEVKIIFSQFLFWILFAGDAYNTYRFWFTQLFYFSLFSFSGLIVFIDRFKIRRIAVNLIIVIFCVYAIHAIFVYSKYFSGIKYIAGHISYEEFQNQYNSRSYSLIQEISKRIGPNEKLFIRDGGIRLYFPINNWRFISMGQDDIDYYNTSEKTRYISNNNFRYIFYRRFGNIESDYSNFLKELQLSERQIVLKDNHSVIFDIIK